MGQKFHKVATNTEADAVWGVLGTKHVSGNGWEIGKYDAEQQAWQIDVAQPKGSKKDGLIVDSKGFPAVIQDDG